MTSHCFLFFSIILFSYLSFFFFFNDTATTEIYTLSLHDALPIFRHSDQRRTLCRLRTWSRPRGCTVATRLERSEEHTSELQSHSDLVCRLLLEKKKKKQKKNKQKKKKKTNTKSYIHICQKKSKEE